MPAELTSSALKKYSGRLHGKRRHGIRLRTRRIERARAGQARNANLPLDLCVIRFQIGISDWPIDERRAGNRPDFAALDEINFVEAPIVRREVHASPADTAAIDQRALRFGLLVRRLANRSRLKLWVVGELVLGKDFDFVVCEIGLGQIGALLENNHAKAIGGKFLGQDAAGRAGAYDDEVHLIRSIVFGLLYGHFFSASFAPGSQPG